VRPKLRVQETWSPKHPFKGPYFPTQNWTQARRLGCQTRKSIFFNEDHWNFAGKWCHINATTVFIPWPRPQCKLLASEVLLSTNKIAQIGVSLIMDPTGNPTWPDLVSPFTFASRLGFQG
jgi:hypothetical protein